jgi:hypothetical protein
MLRGATPSITDRPDVFLAKAKQALQIGEKVKTKYIQNLQRAGRNMGEFSVQKQDEAAAKVQSKGSAPAWQAFIRK